MPVRVPHHSIALHRDGQTVRPEVGKPFDFTYAEVAEINVASPAALRRAVVERVSPVADEDDDAAAAAAELLAATKLGKKAAKAKVTTTTDDDEL